MYKASILLALAVALAVNAQGLPKFLADEAAAKEFGGLKSQDEFKAWYDKQAPEIKKAYDDHMAAGKAAYEKLSADAKKADKDFHDALMKSPPKDDAEYKAREAEFKKSLSPSVLTELFGSA